LAPAESSPTRCRILFGRLVARWISRERS